VQKSYRKTFFETHDQPGENAMRIFYAVPTLFLLAAVCAASADQGAQAARIAELEAEWSARYGERDLDGIMALMAEKSVLIVPGAPPIEGVDAIREATRAMLEGTDEVSWQSDFAFVSSAGDMAYDYGKATTRRGDGSVVEGYYLVVWVKENGEWKVAADMFN
jgi:ketosteroid isomerase-like protein